MGPPSPVGKRYELEGELARGGMGVVFRARDRTTGEVVALKRGLTEGKAHPELIRSMLEREYQTLVTLRHPRIIQVYDFGVDELGPYYTMEMLDGADLRARCPLPWRDVCTYLRDVASSLSLLHSRRLIHRDVSVGNIRLTGEGRAKLLDFGALVSFGKPGNITGTAPTTAPEALELKALDQRVDLYSLGATAYHALCGRHAYPAKTLALLPAMWAQGRPPPPSTHVPDIPPELDELVLTLLDLDPASRPSSAAEVMDRLGAIAGIPPDYDERVQRSYLYGAQLVGREAERQQLEARFSQALTGGAGVVIEGASGLGKTCLLEDTLQRARLAGARIISVRARAHPNALGVWSEIVRESEKMLFGPHVAAGKEATGKIARTSLLPRPLSRGQSMPPWELEPDTPMHELASQAPLVLAVDDLHEADTDSIVAYSALAKAARSNRILLLATIDSSHPQAARPAVRLLRTRLSTMELRPLDEPSTHAFVTGLFGDVSGATRLGAFLMSHAGGNPRAYTEVIEHLIARDYIRYAEGTWVLPDALPDGLELASLVDAAIENRIASLSSAARLLATCLCPHRRVFDVDLCRALSRSEPELEGHHPESLLRELTNAGVLVGDRGAYVFTRSRLRDLLYERMDIAQRKARHGSLAEALRMTSGHEVTRGFDIGYHLLLAGQEAKARAEINQAAEPSLFDPELLVAWVPDLLFIAQQQRSVGASDEDLQFVEGLLVLAGYYTDPTVQDRLVGRVIPMLHRTVGFALANRLAPWLGSHLALVIGLFSAWLRNACRRTTYVVAGRKLLAPVMLFTSACIGWSAAASFRLEHQTHPHLRQLFSVARGLGRFNGLRLLYDLFEIGANVVRGRFREVEAGLEDQLRRVHAIPGLEGGARDNYEAGLQLFIGRNQLLRLDSKTLESADRIDALGAPRDLLMAHFLRRTYYLYRGEVLLAQQAEERFDDMAARVGSRWVADVTSVSEIAPFHLSGDVLGLKRALHRIDRLVPIAPNLAMQREIIRAMYEGHRGRPERALAIYASIEAGLEPFRTAGWSAARAHQAESLNALGRHVEALAVCEQARAQLTPADRVYVFAYQQLERESAHALAGLGRIEEATELSERLLAECAGYDNPLAIGLLHHDRARIAYVARDRRAFERHVQAAKEAFFATGNPALLAKVRRLRARGVAAALLVDTPQPYQQDQTEVSVLDRERAEQVLNEVVRALQPGVAFLYLVAHGGAELVARHGESNLGSSIYDQLANLVQTLEDGLDAGEECQVHNVESILGSPVKVVPLVAYEGTRGDLVGLLVLEHCYDSIALAELDVEALAATLRGNDELETAALRA